MSLINICKIPNNCLGRTNNGIHKKNKYTILNTLTNTNTTIPDVNHTNVQEFDEFVTFGKFSSIDLTTITQTGKISNFSTNGQISNYTLEPIEII